MSFINKNTMKIIAIGGNIGCGKSTLIKSLSDRNISCYSEPIEKWQPWLNIFYESPEKNALGFQMKILIEYAKMMNTVDKSNEYIIVERSSLDNVYIFSKNLVESGILNEHEYTLVKDFHNMLYIRQPDLYIYIQTDPIECIKRIKERQRDCETSIQDDYIKCLHEKYEEFTFTHMKTINGNQEKEKVLEDVLSEIYNIQ